MDVQLNYPFVTEFPSSFPAEGIMTPFSFLGYSIPFNTPMDLSRGVSEFLRIERILGKRNLDGERVEGRVYLLPSVAEEFYPENFIPTNFASRAERIQEEPNERNVWVVDALRRDGIYQKIVIKGPKYSKWHLYQPPKSWITPLDRLGAHKTSKTELETLVQLADAGVPVEEPLGYFEEGIEQYAFTKFVEGENPKDILEGSRRFEVWNADATLLARLSREGYKHQYFYSPEFDDKIWDGEKLVLIDVDETFKIQDGFEISHNQIQEYHLSTLKDVLASYVSRKVMSSDEMPFYARTFFGVMGWNPDDAEYLVRNLDPNKMTEESYNAIMMDTD